MNELNAKDILEEITYMVSKDVSYLDALVEYAERHDVEVEVVGEIIRRNQAAMSKIREDAEKLCLVEKTKRLPV